MTTDAGTTTDHYAEPAVTAAADGRGEPGWLRDRRAEAARAFDATPLPTRALRPWRYTDVTGLDFAAFAPTAGALRIAANAPDGAYAGTIADALGSQEALLRDGLGSLTPADRGQVHGRQRRAVERTACSSTPRPARSSRSPWSPNSTCPTAIPPSSPRLLVVAGEQAEVTVVLRACAPATRRCSRRASSRSRPRRPLACGCCSTTAGARTRRTTPPSARASAATPTLQVASIAIGARVLKQTVEVTLEGEGANSAIRAVALGDEDQHFDFVTLQDHTGPRTTSDVEVKAALAGASRSIYYGITRVGEEAAGAEANQQNRNLLLSNASKADSDPVLEILTADVIRCGHGATVGPVDEEALFYLQSRGLDRRTSLQLLVSGFFQSVLRDVRLEGVAEELEETVFAKLALAEL